jgi:hypothetical protein
MQQKKWSPAPIYVLIIIGLIFLGCCKKPVHANLTTLRRAPCLPWIEND